jgi:cytochrome c
MKKIVLLLSLFLLISCKKEAEKETLYTEPEVAKTPEQIGQILFEGVGNCVACHQVDKKIIGPSIQEIAKIYKDNSADMVLFLKGEGKPIVDPSQYEVMKTNFTITKTLSDQELQALEAYFYSHLK